MIFISMVALLAVILSVIAYMLSNSKKTYVFPPFINECPDFYQKNPQGYCVDAHHIFTPRSGGPMNLPPDPCSSESFRRSIYTKPGKGKESGLCQKLKWANQCKVPWDGITNNDGLCI